MSEIRNRNNDLQWKDNTEKIFKKWSDHATCYAWMHDRSYKKYNCHYTWFTVPVIILSTITGTANFAHQRYKEYENIITMVIGIRVQHFPLSLSLLANVSTRAQSLRSVGKALLLA